MCNDRVRFNQEELMHWVHETFAAIAFVVFCIATIAICTVLA